MAEDTISAQDGMSTFARSQVALAEAVRVLARGGTYAMTDVLLDRTRAAPGVVAAVDRLPRRRPYRSTQHFWTAPGCSGDL